MKVPSQRVLAITAVVMILAAGFLVWNSTKPTPPPPQIKMVIPGQGASTKPVAEATARPEADAAKSAVVKYVLAAANPSKPVAPAEKQAALALLSEDLKSQAAGDPGKLFGIPTPASFTVATPTVRRDVAATTVTFKFNGAADARFTVSLKLQNGQWQITAIERITVRQG
jgi:hypothetical protein